MKPLLDAVVALPTDDSPLALAAAAVLYFLALDVSQQCHHCCVLSAQDCTSSSVSVG